MTVKSILEIDIDDAQFQEFYKYFQKYQQQVKDMPKAWANVGKNIDDASKSATEFSESTGNVHDNMSGTAAATALTAESLLAVLQAHAALSRKIASDEKKSADEAKRAADQQERSAKAWRGMSVGGRDLVRSIGNITASLLKWTSLTGIFAGLTGVAELFGLERLAANVGSGRKSSLGLGVTYGEQKSFETNYGRLFDPDAALSGVNSSLTDLSKRYALYGAGLSESDIHGKGTGQVLTALLPKLFALADRTPTSMLAQAIQARGIDQLGFTVQDFERMKATPLSERAEYAKNFQKGVGAFGLDEQTQKAWQDLQVQLHSAGQQIETTFVKGLKPLVGPITALSKSVTNALSGFLSNPNLKNQITDFGKGIEQFAKYVGSDKFQQDVKTFADDVAYAAKKIAGAMRFLGLLPDDPNSASSIAQHNAADKVFNGGRDQKALPGSSILNDNPNRPFSWADPGSYLHGEGSPVADWFRSHKTLLGERASWVMRPNETNPANIRVPGQNTGYAHFDSADAGVRATARQVLLYETRDHLDTIEKIIAKFAPKKDHNDVEAYIKDVVARTGIGRSQHLHANDVGEVSRVVSALLHHENNKKNAGYSPGVVVKILNNTGGNAVTQTAQLAH